MDMRRNPNQQSNMSVMPIIVFGVLSLIFGVFMYAVFPSLGVLPVQASTQAVRTDELFRILMGVGGVVFFLVQGLIYYAAVAFRAKANDVSDGPTIHGNTMLEIVWTIAPSITVVVLAILAFLVWQENTALADEAERNLVNGENIAINVTGQRFAWSFEYVTKEENIEGDIIVLNASDFHTYAGQNIYLEMQTRDVIHSFWIPAMRVKQDLLPGRMTNMTFTTRDPQVGWAWAAALNPVTVYAADNTGADVVFEVPSPAEGEFPMMVELELADPNAGLEGDWTEVIVNGEPGFVETEAITGRFNRYAIVCAELCGTGHGDMARVSEVFLYENEEAFLNIWYNPEVAKRVIPPAGPIALGQDLLASGGYPCASCHVLDALGWVGQLGPNLNGIADRAAERASELGDVESGVEYLAQSLRNPNAYLVSGFGGGIMPVFDSAQMPQEDLNAIISFLCTQTESGDPADSTCGLENLQFDEEGKLVDVGALEAELTEITDKYE